MIFLIPLWVKQKKIPTKRLTSQVSDFLPPNTKTRYTHFPRGQLPSSFARIKALRCRPIAIYSYNYKHCMCHDCVCAGEHQRTWQTRPSSELQCGRNVRRRGAQYPDDRRSLDEKRQRLHRPSGNLRSRGSHGCRFQSAHDLIREYINELAGYEDDGRGLFLIYVMLSSM